MVYSFTKRLLDITLSAVLIFMLSPVLFTVCLALYLVDGPNVIFKSKRIGQGKRTFVMFKFRTMKAITLEEEIAERSEGIKLTYNSSYHPKGSTKVVNQNRITPLGRYLRKYSIDELPQLFNVLRGEMSLVGPRPIASYEIDYFPEKNHVRFEAKPGMTGLWQITGRGITTNLEMIAIDERYIRDRSIIGDVLILLKTVPAVISAKGAG